MRWHAFGLFILALCGAASAGVARAQDEPALVNVAMRGPRFLNGFGPGATPIDPAGVASLRRRVTLRAGEATLGSVLRALAQQSGVRLLYSRDVVPVETHIRLDESRVSLAAALTEVLLDTGVDVAVGVEGQLLLMRRVGAAGAGGGGTIVGRVTDVKTKTALAGATVVVQGTSHSATTGSDGRYRITAVAPGAYTLRVRYIGYAPGTASVTVSAEQEATADLALEKSAQRLDEVVTTGTVVPTEVKALPTPISVVTGDEIGEKGYQRVDQIFRGDIPGAIAWDQGPFDYYSTIAVRGASTLDGSGTVKTFVDGVEVADPGPLGLIDPNSVDRIELTRGPQASTMYGSGALNGVMQIFTKKGRLGLARPEITGKVSAGGLGGYGGQSTALQTDDALSILGGGDRSSYNLGGSYRHTGEWLPGYHSAAWGVSAGGQTTQGPLKVSSSLRYADNAYDQPSDPRFQAYTYWSKPFFEAHHLRQQTYGLTATLQAKQSWQHTLTLGYDQTYLDIAQTQARFTSPADSFLFAYAIHEARTSLLYHTDLSLPLATGVGAIVTAGINYDAFDDVQSYTGGATHTTGSLDGSTSLVRSPSTTTGYFGQVQMNLAGRLFLTGGLRAERNPLFGVDFGTAWSPRVGAAYLQGFGPVTLKLRASYGEGIRAPAPGQRDPTQGPGYQQLANTTLAPERQHGADGGVDVYIGRASIGVSYYNQRAIDLIQGVTIPTAPGTPYTFQFQNIARVKNDGWEFEARVPVGNLQLAGTYSITHSTIQQLPSNYPVGGYQVGDQILAIPRTSAGASVVYSPLPRTTLTASMTYIGHWLNTDYLSYYAYSYGGAAYRGSNRAYWLEYPTVTKFSVGVSQVVTNQLTAFARAENVGNNLRNEQDDYLTFPKPRSVLVGANFRY